MNRKTFFSALILAAATLLIAPQPAAAYYSICNKTFARLATAFGYKENDNWVSEGWWHLDPGECVTAFDAKLTARYYYYLAVNEANGKQWGGDYQFCVDNKPFKITDSKNCAQQGLQSRGFHESDVGKFESYTLDLRE